MTASTCTSAPSLAVDPLSLDLYPGAAASSTADGARLIIGQREGSYAPSARALHLRVHRVDGPVVAVERSDVALAEHDSYAMLVASGDGRWYDAAVRALVAIMPDATGVELRLRYDPAIADVRPTASRPTTATDSARTRCRRPTPCSAGATGARSAGPGGFPR